MKYLESAAQKVREMGYTPVYAALYGSQNYGLDVYSDDHQSDYDVKVIVMPTLHDLIFKGSQVSMTLEYEGGQIDVKDAISMTGIFSKMNTQYLEILLTPFYLVFPGGEYMEELRALLPELLATRAPLFARATLGHFQEKLAKATKMSPSNEERIRKHGYDGKSLHHALRLRLMLEDFEKTGRMVLHPPSDQVSYLTRLKKNEVSLEEAASQAMLWNQDIVDCANRIIKASDVTDEVSSKMMDATRNAVYFAVRSEASGIQKVMDVSEVKHE